MPSSSTGPAVMHVQAEEIVSIEKREEDTTAAQCCRNDTRVMGADSDEDTPQKIYEGPSIWHFSIFSIVWFWFQGLTVGVLSLLWSLISGHCIRQLLFSSSTYLSLDGGSHYARETTRKRRNWIQEYLSILRAIFEIHDDGTPDATEFSKQNKTSSTASYVYAWPHPSLIGLTIFTMLVVLAQPDDLTRMLYDKIRLTMSCILQTSSTCWVAIMKEYGLFGIVSVSVSLAVVLILAITIHRTFFLNWFGGNAPTDPRESPIAAAQKQKTVEYQEDQVYSVRSGTVTRAVETVQSASSIPSCSRLQTVGEVSADGVKCCRNSLAAEETRLESTPDDNIKEPDPVEESKSIANEERQRKSSSLESRNRDAVDVAASPPLLELIARTDEGEIPGRERVPSVCTLDTTIMSTDDLSCESSLNKPAVSAKPRNNRKRSNKRGKNKSKRGGPKQAPSSSKAETPAFASATDGYHGNERLSNMPTHLCREGEFNAKVKNHNNNEPHKHGNRGKVGGGDQNLNCQISRDGRGNRVSGRHQKSRKNQLAGKQYTISKGNAASVPSSPGQIPASPNGSKADSRWSGHVGGNTPMSPAAHNLVSCEIGASGWSFPCNPVSSVPVSPGLDILPVQSYSANSYLASHSRSPAGGYPSPNPSLALSDASASIDSRCRLWESVQSPGLDKGQTMGNNSTTPQRPVRAPPGFAPSIPYSPNEYTAVGRDGAMTPSYPYSPNQYTAVRRDGAMAPSYLAQSPSFGASSGVDSCSLPLPIVGGGGFQPSPFSRVKENPFADDDNYDNNRNSDDAEGRIEAQLQELGGQMVGNVLDF